VPEKAIRRISRLTEEICICTSADTLGILIEEHEIILSEILKRDPVGTRFTSFPGYVKSLGSWGGDFVMFVSSAGSKEVETYLSIHGLDPVFRYDELAVKQ